MQNENYTNRHFLVLYVWSMFCSKKKKKDIGFAARSPPECKHNGLLSTRLNGALSFTHFIRCLSK